MALSSTVFVQHPLIKPETVEYRAYQENIAKKAAERSTLVVLPTGMGKTIIAVLTTALHFEKGGKKVLFLAPTKPLVEQHAETIANLMNIGDIAVFTGSVRPRKRKEMWKEAKVVVATPQTVVNDILSWLDLSEVSMIVFDEAHRAVGDYDYVFIGKRYQEKRKEGLVLGTTASPSYNQEKVHEVIENLGIEAVEVRTPDDPDVVDYVNRIKPRWVKVDLPPEMQRIRELLKGARDEFIKELKATGFLTGRRGTKRELIALGGEIQKKINMGDRSAYRAATLRSMAIKLDQALEFAETQPVGTLLSYLQRIVEDANTGRDKSSKLLVKRSDFMGALQLAREHKDMEHPKMAALKEILEREMSVNEDRRIIIFANYRDTGERIVNAVKDIKGIRAFRFVGQASKNGDKGMGQKEQKRAIEDFRSGKYNVMVATSVAEEGLDIPATDLVIFYEPVASEIRTIQRRGRTGRKREGRVIFLITRKTRDEAYYWTARRKESEMLRNLRAWKAISDEIFFEKAMVKKHRERKDEKTAAKDELIRKMEVAVKKGQLTLEDYISGEKEEKKRIEIVVDHREGRSSVVKELYRLGASIKGEQLGVADYLLSERIAVERKEVGDFLTSVMDGRLFQQAGELSGSYMRPVFIIEGRDLFTTRMLSENAIMGAIASLIGDYRCSVLLTKDAVETAKLLYSMARREQEGGRGVGRRGEKKRMGTHQQQRFIVEGLPGISATMAERLLLHFGTVERIMTAGEKELMEVEGIGKKRAKAIREVLTKKYLKGAENEEQRDKGKEE